MGKRMPLSFQTCPWITVKTLLFTPLSCEYIRPTTVPLTKLGSYVTVVTVVTVKAVTHETTSR